MLFWVRRGEFTLMLGFVRRSLTYLQLSKFLGQYDGYADDPTIEKKDTNTPTFATIHLRVHTPRWNGVPFIMKAG